MRRCRLNAKRQEKLANAQLDDGHGQIKQTGRPNAFQKQGDQATNANLRQIEISQLTCPGRSVLVCDGAAGRTPVILVHGIIDSVRRWISRADEQAAGLTLSEYVAPPVFDLENLTCNAMGRFPGLWSGPGLLGRLAASGIPAAAFTYQGLDSPVADMPVAVAALHRLIDWALRHWDVKRVDLIGHSRGGLVIRHALQSSSEYLSAEDACRATRNVICIASPFRGSRLAEFFHFVSASWTPFEKGVTAASQWLSKSQNAGVGSPFGRFILNIAQLCPDSEEVRLCASDRLPRIGGDHFLIAGSDPTYYRCEMNGLGSFRFPPAAPLAELTPGQGDLAVSVASALDGGELPNNQQAVFPANHVVTPFDPRVQNQVLKWLSGP